MSRRASPPTTRATSASPVGDARFNNPGLVSAAFDDSWSTLEQEVALIDRLFGGEIAALFERPGHGNRNVRG
ncbi:hypothetical protein [Sphingomonas sp. SORGH_AS_0879]|uniref:hypothetical protein n=1 Tax=Sphingomonas sp. SORGH_AS_0879 TaxID=3041790 RepID=UPI00277D2E61|nr:hypothetical protein [Sphingomonas sp. SORGH_AS_0879]MDQ1232167.1 hypothetical protein [Sphingomonas sp. SORGH_AS_0879]